VIAIAVVIGVVNRKAHQERNKSKSLTGRVAAVLYTQSVSTRPSGTSSARLLHAYRTEIVEPVVLHTSQAQPQSHEKVSSGVVSLPTEHAATRRDTYETWGHHAFSRARKPETSAQTASTTARWHPEGWGVDAVWLA
jgi:hypothetical protein